MRGVLIGALLAAVLVACASQSAQSPAIDPRKDEIQNEWQEIRDWRVKNGMTPDPDMRAERFFGSVPDIRKCTTEREPTTELCTDTCGLKDAICDNAEHICRIAEDLNGDPWADGKCDSAKASCKEATAKCCKCTEREETAPASLQR